MKFHIFKDAQGFDMLINVEAVTAAWKQGGGTVICSPGGGSVFVSEPFDEVAEIIWPLHTRTITPDYSKNSITYGRGKFPAKGVRVTHNDLVLGKEIQLSIDPTVHQGIRLDIGGRDHQWDWDGEHVGSGYCNCDKTAPWEDCRGHLEGQRSG